MKGVTIVTVAIYVLTLSNSWVSDGLWAGVTTVLLWLGGSCHVYLCICFMDGYGLMVMAIMLAITIDTIVL
jgi:hypothetical protein